MAIMSYVRAERIALSRAQMPECSCTLIQARTTQVRAKQRKLHNSKPRSSTTSSSPCLMKRAARFPNVRYRITLANGQVLTATTNENGHTQRVTTSADAHLKLEIKESL
ncbi:hypothetical protein [Paraburkholderia sp. BL10I2N1]|uniref:hypothetical protein n=1 Tax=Paraburkholderia sp. BL10I2N1 TaxID=1938796 RepID=UPI001FB70F7A|nr:hypothetical protein [Paraburkholderia sp. BL10I2N1]